MAVHGDVANTRIGLSGSSGSGLDALSQEKHKGDLVGNKLQVAMCFRLEAAMSLLALPHQQEVGLAERTSESQKRISSVTTFKASLVVTGSPHSSCGQYLKLLREESNEALGRESSKPVLQHTAPGLQQHFPAKAKQKAPNVQHALTPGSTGRATGDEEPYCRGRSLPAHISATPPGS